MNKQEMDRFKKYHVHGEITFAIAELEKVKAYLSGQFMLITKNASDLDKAEVKGRNDFVKDVIEEIHKQISELKVRLNENKN